MCDVLWRGCFLVRKPTHIPSWFFYLSDLLVTWLALWLADGIRRAIPFGRDILPGTVYLTPAIYGMVAVIWSVAFALFDVYATGRRRAIDEMRSIVSALSVSILLLAGAIYFTRTRDFSRLLVAYFSALDLLCLLGYRWLVKMGIALLRGNGLYTHSRTMIVGAGPTAIEVARRICEHPWAGLHLVGFARDDMPRGQQAGDRGPILSDLRGVRQAVLEHDIDCVILALPIEQAGMVSPIILALQDLPVQIYVVPDYVGIVALAPKVEDLYGIPLIGITDLRISGLNRVLKRLLDVVVASIAILLLLPLFVVIAIAIRLDSAGPIFFVQRRVGQNGRCFNMYKFRSMVVGAEELLERILHERGVDAPPLKIKDDPRVTRVGRILRRTSLDELPQLFNVIKGDMSLVGPRPEEPRIVQTYDAWQRKRLSVKPGITGPMQVNGRADLALDDRVRLELDYIQRYSLLEDLKLLAKTLPAIISGRGSY